MSFMYSGEAIVPQEGIQSFLKTAEMLEIKGLLENSDDNKQRNIQQNKDNGPTCFKDSELTVTTKKSDKMGELVDCIPVMYSQMNMNNPNKLSKSNPLIKAYEANNKRKSSEHNTSSSEHSRKSSRNYEASAPVFDNRNIYPVDVVQPHFEGE